jgi:hypothetical protein
LPSLAVFAWNLVKAPLLLKDGVSMPLTLISAGKDRVGNIFVFAGLHDSRGAPELKFVGLVRQWSNPDTWALGGSGPVVWQVVYDGSNSFAVGPPTQFEDGWPSLFILAQGTAYELAPTGRVFGPYFLANIVTPSGQRQSGLGGTNLKYLTVNSNADGRLEVFALGGDRGLWHTWQQSPRGSGNEVDAQTWGGWETLTGTDLQQIVVGSNADGRLEVFALGGDRGLWHVWQQSPNGAWGDWQSLGGTELQELVLGTNADGRLEVFALGGDRGLWHIWQQSPNGAWGGWQSLDGTDLQAIAVGSNADGRLEVFSIGGDRGLWHVWQLSPNGDWGGWQSLGGTDLQQIAVGSNADGRMEVFGVGGDQRLWHIRQASPNGGWGGWEILVPDAVQ